MSATVIEVPISIPVEITPELAAKAFTDGDTLFQALFFNEIAKLVEGWAAPFCMQMQYLTDDPDLSIEGRAVMRTIGDYSEAK